MPSNSYSISQFWRRRWMHLDDDIDEYKKDKQKKNTFFQRREQHAAPTVTYKLLIFTIVRQHLTAFDENE